uniref:Uncharacterized protein n=1 Tax=Arundo donax TaxID=35708 RepID=A0A0A9BP50_ARUDO
MSTLTMVNNEYGYFNCVVLNVASTIILATI